MTAMITTTIVKGDLRVKVRSAGDVIGNIERVSGQGPTGPIAEHCDSENEGDNALKHSNQGEGKIPINRYFVRPMLRCLRRMVGIQA